MKFILLVAVIAVLTFIPSDGSPLPKEEKSSSVQDGKENDKSPKKVDETMHTSEEDDTDKKSTPKNTKSKSSAKNEEKSKKVTPEPVIEEEENHFYIMVPASGNRLQNFKPLHPFNFKKIPKMPLHPQFVFKQPRIPTIPFTYPMFTSEDHPNPMLGPETEYTFPNAMTQMTDDLPMYYIPSLQKGQSFENNVDRLNQVNQSPFTFTDKETNSWNTYLENYGYYK